MSHHTIFGEEQLPNTAGPPPTLLTIIRSIWIWRELGQGIPTIFARISSSVIFDFITISTSQSTNQSNLPDDLYFENPLLPEIGTRTWNNVWKQVPAGELSPLQEGDNNWVQRQRCRRDGCQMWSWRRAQIPLNRGKLHSNTGKEMWYCRKGGNDKQQANSHSLAASCPSKLHAIGCSRPLLPGQVWQSL